jgi:hypothetical protein
MGLRHVLSLLATGIVLAAPASAQAPTLTQPSLVQPSLVQPLPGLPVAADQSLWCASMAAQLAESALQSGDMDTFEILAPLAISLSQHISTLFVALQVGEPDVADYQDLYASEIERVLAGASPERYTPEECKGMVHPGLVA